MTDTVQVNTVALPRAADSCMRMLSRKARVRAVGGSGLSTSGRSGEVGGGSCRGDGFTTPLCAVRAASSSRHPAGDLALPHEGL